MIKDIFPIGKSVLVEPVHGELEGLVMPDTKFEGRPDHGKVIACDSIIVKLGNQDFMVKEGDIVYFDKFRGIEITEEGKSYYFIPFDALCGVLSNV